MSHLDVICRQRSRIKIRLGPAYFADADEAADEAAQRELIEAALAEVCVLEYHPRMRFIAPSAWHAAMFLQALHIGCVVGRDKDHAIQLPGPMVYRGMCNSSWSIVSSLERTGRDPVAALQANAFAALMEATARPIQLGEVSSRLFLAVAQHYGLPTDLIDFSPDPDIAVWFASRESFEASAVVYFAPVQELVEQGFAVILPPPLFQRIQLQRGVFIESAGKLGKNLFHSIEFPSDPEFQVYRGGDPIELLPSPLWIEHAKAFVQALSRDEAARPTADLERMWWKSDPSFFATDTSLRFDPEVEIARWLEYFEEMRYWLSCVFWQSMEGFRSDLLAALEDQNRTLYAFHTRMVKVLGKPY